MSILPLLLHVKTFSQGFMSTKDPGSRRSLIYIATIHKGGTQLSGYYSDSSHQDVNREGKQHMNPKDLETRPRPTEWRSTLARQPLTTDRLKKPQLRESSSEEGNDLVDADASGLLIPKLSVATLR